MKKFLLLSFIIFFYLNFSNGKGKESNLTQKKLLIRCDDIGMCHSVNMACKRLIDAGIKFSASVMFVCPWYLEAVEILKNQPNVSIGVHLTLNSEWKNYRWGPAAGAKSVPSLVDSSGFFFPTRAEFYANNPKLEEIELELRAQIERALKTGLKIDYVDYHMGTAVSKPEYRAIVEKLAKEYNLGISRYFGEIDIKNVYSTEIEKKSETLTENILSFDFNEHVGLLVCHIGLDTEELASMTDLNPSGLKNMSKHREAELKSLTNYRFQKTLEDNKIVLINYKELIDEVGLTNMKRPE